MILRFFSFLSLLVLTLMGFGVAQSYFKDPVDTLLTMVLVLAVLCAATYFLSANFPRLPWSRR